MSQLSLVQATMLNWAVQKQYATYEGAVIAVIAPNHYLILYFLWEYHFYLRLFYYAHFFRNTTRA